MMIIRPEHWRLAGYEVFRRCGASTSGLGLTGSQMRELFGDPIELVSGRLYVDRFGHTWKYLHSMVDPEIGKVYGFRLAT